MKALIEKLRDGVDLIGSDISYAMTLLLSDETDDKVKVHFLTELHRKGESADEIIQFVRLLMEGEGAVDPMIDPAELPGPMIDICGTGGAGLHLFNVSTTIMFILAAGGAVVVKHGNRMVTSLCGSADVLEELGVPIKLGPQQLRDCVECLGIGFIFAPQYYPAFRAIAGMRERLARENRHTIFNLLGPLLNPARPRRQLIGVFAPRLPPIFAEVLRQLGRERAWVVHGLAADSAGMDNISTCGATTIAELQGGEITSAVLDVNWLGIPRAAVVELQGGNARENAATLEGILAGKITGPRRDIAVANAAGGFVVAGLARDLNEGIALAGQQIDTGRALAKLHALRNYEPKVSR